jgi:hypothetical protein
MKIGYSLDLDTTAYNCPFFLLKTGKTCANFLDANVIWVSPECHDIGGLTFLYHGTFLTETRTFKSDKGVREKIC